MAKPPRSVALKPASEPESLPIGVRAPARMTEPAIYYFPQGWSGGTRPTLSSGRERPLAVLAVVVVVPVRDVGRDAHARRQLALDPWAGPRRRVRRRSGRRCRRRMSGRMRLG